ncbi:GNAT family N-acetyltransferase [Psychrobacter sp.]|uniref:GNAT family N-acetyltransferase n=1 Tax=Psychrobacter sp. TaxID=56811 RepID=UPI002649748F|nr:GNAT family N-acetyltransferase [Psychrobacter sp.]
MTLSQKKILPFFRPIIIKKCLPALTLKCIKDGNGSMLGFIKIKGSKIEMLFVTDKARGKGIGKQLSFSAHHLTIWANLFLFSI